ncbi:cac [Symbiodinium microadriaticum]|nr:cac [Symbiodinium microadriaticum]
MELSEHPWMNGDDSEPLTRDKRGEGKGGAHELQELRRYLEDAFAKQAATLQELKVQLRGTSTVQTFSIPVPRSASQREDADTVTESWEGGAASPGASSANEGAPSRLSAASGRSGSSLAVPAPAPPSAITAQSSTYPRESAGPVPSMGARQSFFRGALQAHMKKANVAGQSLAMQRRASSAGYEVDGAMGIKGLAQRIVGWPYFTHFIMLLILANVILLGIEVDVSSSLGVNDVPQSFGIINLVIVGVFVVEVTLKLLAMGCSTYWLGPDSAWNIFDFCIVAVSVGESLINFWAEAVSDDPSEMDGSNAQQLFASLLRLARALRGIRVVRLFRYVSALRTLVLSIVGTTASLFWTLVMLMILFYGFGIALTQLVVDHCRLQTIAAQEDPNAIPRCPDDLGMYWESVPESMLTLFMAISGGLSWDDAMRPIRKVSSLAFALVILYIVIAVFAVLNVVTGVFCNTAIESASADKEVATIKQARKRAAQVDQLKDIFKELDHSGSNNISLQDMEEAIDTKKLSHFLDSIGISTDDVWTFFMLLDRDENGLIDIEEFVSGCMQLNGPAKSLQLAKMSYENKLTRQALKKLSGELRFLSERINHLAPREQLLEI